MNTTGNANFSDPQFRQVEFADPSATRTRSGVFSLDSNSRPVYSDEDAARARIENRRRQMLTMGYGDGSGIGLPQSNQSLDGGYVDFINPRFTTGGDTSYNNPYMIQEGPELPPSAGQYSALNGAPIEFSFSGGRR